MQRNAAAADVGEAFVVKKVAGAHACAVQKVCRTCFCIPACKSHIYD